jgi:micrococcal nuclease
MTMGQMRMAALPDTAGTKAGGGLAICSVIAITLLPTGAMAQERHVVDGDTLRIGDNKYRLWGVDAPEMSDRDGPPAKEELSRIIGDDPVRCRKKGRSHNRIVAVCSTPRFFDIGMELIRRGYALDCTKISKGRYLPVEPLDARQRLHRSHYC